MWNRNHALLGNCEELYVHWWEWIHRLEETDLSRLIYDGDWKSRKYENEDYQEKLKKKKDSRKE